MKTLTKPEKSQSVSPHIYGYEYEDEGSSWQWVGTGYAYPYGDVNLYECLDDNWGEYECDLGDTCWGYDTSWC